MESPIESIGDPGRKRPQVSQKRSVMDRPDSLWSADLTRIYCGEDGWCPLIAVVDNGSREVPGYRFSRKGGHWRPQMPWIGP